MESIINYNNATVCRDKRIIIKEINFKLLKGEFMLLSGGIGSGKSTFLKTVYADLPIESGTAEVLGFNINNISKKEIPMLRRQIGMIFQDYLLFENKTVYDNLLFAIQSLEFKPDVDIRTHVLNTLAIAGILFAADTFPHKLSGGERRCVAVARALVCNPLLILADEPTGNLDTENARRVANVLKSCTANGTTVLTVSHDESLFSPLADKVAKIENGIFLV